MEGVYRKGELSLLDINREKLRIIASDYRKRVEKFWSQSTTLKSIAAVGLGDFFSQVINVLSAIVLIRGLSVADYAAFSAMNSIANLSAGVVGTGINLALVRFSATFFSQTGKKLNSLYYFVFIIEIILFLLVTILALCFPEQATLLFIGEINYVASLQFGLLYGLGMLLTQLGRSIYQAEENFKKFVYVLLLRQGATLAVILLLWAFGILSFQAFSIAIVFIYIAIGLRIFIKSSAIHSINQFTTSIIDGQLYIRPFLTAGGWLIGYFILISIISQIDILSIARLSSQTDLATYGVAARYYYMVLIFLGSINSVLLPRFSRIDMQDPIKQRAFTLRWIKVSSWLLVPVLLFDIFGKPLFTWINGAQYAEAFNVLIVFSAGIILSFMLSPQTNILIARGEYRFLFLLSLVAAIFCLAGNSLLVPLWGGMGASIVMICTYNVIIQLPIFIKIIWAGH